VEPEENVSKRDALTISLFSGLTTTKLRPRPAPFRLPVITLQKTSLLWFHNLSSSISHKPRELNAPR